MSRQGLHLHRGGDKQGWLDPQNRIQCLSGRPDILNLKASSSEAKIHVVRLQTEARRCKATILNPTREPAEPTRVSAEAELRQVEVTKDRIRARAAARPGLRAAKRHGTVSCRNIAVSKTTSAPAAQSIPTALRSVFVSGTARPTGDRPADFRSTSLPAGVTDFDEHCFPLQPPRP